MDYVAFDLEIAEELQEDKDYGPRDLMNVGISCAATLTSGGDLRLWHGDELPDGQLADRMTPEQCRDLAQYLMRMEAEGYQIITWNGLGFDFRVLAEECQGADSFDVVQNLAMYHEDMAFHMLCDLFR